MEKNDLTLIQALRRGNSQAWEEILTKYERLLFYIPLKYGLSRDDAADVAQYCFIQLTQNIDTLRDDSNLGGWLSTVAQRQSWRIMQRRQRERTGEAENVAEDTAVLGKTEAEFVSRGEMIAWLHDGLSHIGDRCRELLMALYLDWEQPSYEQVAQKLNLSLGSIGPLRARCLQRLKEVLGNL